MIIKIQRPISTTEPEPFLLMYNEDQSVMAHIPMTEELELGLFQECEYKVYVHGEVIDGTLRVDSFAEEQVW